MAVSSFEGRFYLIKDYSALMDSLKSSTAQNMNDMNDNDIHKDDIIMLKMENLLKIGQPRSMGGRVETDMRASHLKASSMRSNHHLLSIFHQDHH